MADTPLTLLDRLREPHQPEAWDRFVRLYAPLLLHWAAGQGLQPADAEDLAQTVLVKLVRLLPGYGRRGGQTFRGWLFTVCRNECGDFQARRATHTFPGAHGLKPVPPPAPTELEEAEYRKRLVRRALD